MVLPCFHVFEKIILFYLNFKIDYYATNRGSGCDNNANSLGIQNLLSNFNNLSIKVDYTYCFVTKKCKIV